MAFVALALAPHATAGPLGGLSTAAGSTTAGATTSYTFTFTTVSNWNANTGCLLITFPAGYTFASPAVTAFSGPGGAGPAPGAGGLTGPGIAGQTLQFDRDNTGQGGAGSVGGYSITVSGIVNPTLTGLTGTFAIATLQGAACGNANDNGNAPAITITPAALGSFQWSGVPGSATAGTAFAMTVTAKDVHGNTKTDYVGTVSFSSNDPYPATLPGAYTFVAGDLGVHAFPAGFTLKTTGARTVTVAQGAATGTTGAINVGPAAALGYFAWSGVPGTSVAGTAFAMTVTAKDTFQNVKTDYTGTVSFTSDDPLATLPSAYTFTAGDSGVHAFGGFTLKTTGLRVVQVVAGTISATTSGTTVTPGPLASLLWSGVPSSVTAGTTFTMTVAARDAYNNAKTDFTGTVSFSSSDGAAALPSAYAFTAGDAGVRSFTNGFTLQTLGTSTVQAQSGAVAATTSGISVVGPLASFLWTGVPSSTVAGTPFALTVTARDGSGNTKADYAGTVSFTSSDGAAVLPSSYAFVAGDAGVHSFTFTLATTGARTITVTQGSVSASTSAITVTPGPLASFTWSAAPATVSAGSPFPLTLTARDAFGNVKTDYLGNAAFSSTDPYPAALPALYAFAAGDLGTRTFPAFTLFSAGPRTVTAAAGSVTGTTGAITVNPLAADRLAFAAEPAGCNRAAACAVTPAVAVRDLYGNAVPSASPTITLALANLSPACLAASPALLGTSSAPASGGLATFAGLGVSKSCAGVQLRALAPGLAGADSIVVTVAGGTRLTFGCAVCQQPTTTFVGTPFAPPVKVAVLRDDGTVATESTVSVVVALGAHPSGATLVGTSSAAPVAGVAALSPLGVSGSGAGFVLLASAPGLAGVTSTAFSVGGPPSALPDCYAVQGSLSIPAPGVAGNDITWDGHIPGVALATGPQRAAAFGLRPDGAFSYTPIAGFSGRDSFSYRAVHASAQSPPVPVCLDVTADSTRRFGPTSLFDHLPQNPVVGEAVTFSELASDPDGLVVAWSWHIDNEHHGEGTSATHVFDEPGTYRVSLTVRDDDGLQGYYPIALTVAPAGPGRSRDAAMERGGDDAGDTPVPDKAVATVDIPTRDDVAEDATPDMLPPELPIDMIADKEAAMESADAPSLDVEGKPAGTSVTMAALAWTGVGALVVLGVVAAIAVARRVRRPALA